MHMPSPHNLRSSLAICPETAASIQEYRLAIHRMITGEDHKVAIIVGPCSLHDADSAIEYARRLANLQAQVKDTCLLVMRAHVEKPRTCLGWKGMLHDPWLSGDEDLVEGIKVSRRLLLQLADIGIPLACEFLDPLASSYFSDLISWGFIGARTSTSQIHRQLASSLPMPVGFKNSIDGNIETVVQAAVAARHSHAFLHINASGQVCQQKSQGNASTHIVLRGSESKPNYSLSSIKLATNLCEEFELAGRILIDCAHGNSQKQLDNQIAAFSSVLSQYREGNTQILGVMLESHLKEGNQSFSSSACPSTSLTDPCLNWSTTEELLLGMHSALSSSGIMSLVQS